MNPKLAQLATLLEHPDQWPEGFVWDFQHLDTCAIGLGQKAGILTTHTNSDPIHEQLGLTPGRVLTLFAFYTGTPPTAPEVAQRIRQNHG